MGYLFCLILAAIGLTFWVMGAAKPRRRTWVAVMLLPAVAVLGYYFALMLGNSTASLHATPAEVGYPQLLAMIGGVCAILAKPKAPPPARDHHDDTGAAV